MTSITKNNIKLLINKALKIIIPTIILLSVWEIAARIVDNSYFLPGVSATASAIVKTVGSKGFFKIIFTALGRVLTGLALGVLSGVLLATLCHYSSIASAVLTPVISIMKATPVACIIVLLWISMNYTELTIFVVIMMVMPIIWQNVLDGYRAVSKDLLEVADVFELSFAKKLRVLIIPTVSSYLIPALITSIGMAWKAEVAAEIMTNSNMGRLIYDYKTVSYDTVSIFAWTAIIITLSIIFESVAKYALRRIKI